MICSWDVALHYFEVIERDDQDIILRLTGITIKILSLIQPIKALILPHPSEYGKASTLKSLI